MAVTIAASWREDSSATVYARLMAQNGSGLPIFGQGRCLQQADIVSIDFATYDNQDPGAAVNSGSVTISECVFDILQTDRDDPAWRLGQGFNFRHTLGPENFPVGNRVYTVEYKVITTSGLHGWMIFEGQAAAVFSS